MNDQKKLENDTKTKFKNGDKINYSGFDGIIIEILDWTDFTMAEVRLPGGVVCVDLCDLKLINKN